MPPNSAVQYIEDSGFSRDAAVTTTATKKSALPLTYSNFWEEYFSRLERKLESEIKPQLEEFVQYPAGWDSYHAPPLRTDTANFALYVLSTIMHKRTPMPQVVPTSAGGVQLEWHEKDIDLELHITAPFECQVWFYDHRRPDIPETSASLTNDFSILKEPIDFLSSR
jgi:hypothetical protein